MLSFLDLLLLSKLTAEPVDIMFVTTINMFYITLNLLIPDPRFAYLIPPRFKLLNRVTFPFPFLHQPISFRPFPVHLSFLPLGALCDQDCSAVLTKHDLRVFDKNHALVIASFHKPNSP